MIDFSKHLETLKSNNVELKRNQINFNYSFGTVKECRNLIKRGFEYFEPGIKFEWLPEYENIAEYLSNTNNKGLALIGNSGRGKSLILTKIFPTLMASKTKPDFYENIIYKKDGSLKHERIVSHSPFILKVFNAKDNWGKFTQRIIDEVGREKQPIKGEIEQFPAYVDWCEVNNYPLFFCTNMEGKQFEERYGRWTIDRTNKLSTRVIFEGKSLRK